MTFLHLIADYGTGDPAFGEVIHRFNARDDSIDIHPTSVPAFSSIATGFWIAQYSLHNPAFDELAIYANTAPRATEGPMKDNKGEELLYARLDNDIPVIAVNSGHTFSFISDRITSLHEVRTPDHGSQFRSRDFFPKAVIDILNGSDDRIGAEHDISTIPDPPEQQITHIDGYGNIKTSIRASDLNLDQGTTLTIHLNGTEQTALHTANAFEAEHGQIAFAPGSAGGDDPFMELFLRGGSAAERFDTPSPGDRIRYSSNT